MSVQYLFVYGTLMREMDNYRFIAPYSAEVVLGEIAGRLFHLTYGYPALVLDRQAQSVKGELVRIVAMSKALPVLDQLEGYFGQGCPQNLYDRVVCLVKKTDGQMVTAYVYEWSHPEVLADIGTPVVSGCWRRFTAQQHPDVTG